MSLDPLPEWEILVPAASNAGVEYDLGYHRQWDAYVRALAGGITVHRKAKGQWMNEDTLQIEEMIPVHVMCSRDVAFQIAKYTKQHYSQKAVKIKKVSEEAYVLDDKDLESIVLP